MPDKPSANLKPIMFAHRVHELQTILNANGYACALHGSMQRDIDVVAVPWTKNAVKAETLVKRICKQMGLTVSGGPTKKPHGRMAWSLLIEAIGFVDLSVMPRRVDKAHRR